MCSHTCLSAADGECDDGGAVAPYDSCVLGTDCSDCGSLANVTHAYEDISFDGAWEWMLSLPPGFPGSFVSALTIIVAFLPLTAAAIVYGILLRSVGHEDVEEGAAAAPDAGGGVPFAVRRAGTFESRLRAINANFCVLPALGGAINRRDTDRKSPNRISAKHIGHFAGVPRSLVVSTCRATHGKQNACPHVVVCGAIAPAPSSRHTGHENASALATSTRTTSSHDAMRSASLELARRSALSATKNRKFACKKSAREHERAPRDRRRLAANNIIKGLGSQGSRGADPASYIISVTVPTDVRWAQNKRQ